MATNRNEPWADCDFMEYNKLSEEEVDKLRFPHTEEFPPEDHIKVWESDNQDLGGHSQFTVGDLIDTLSTFSRDMPISIHTTEWTAETIELIVIEGKRLVLYPFRTRVV